MQDILDKYTTNSNQKLKYPSLIMGSILTIFILASPPPLEAEDFQGNLAGISITDSNALNQPPVAEFTYIKNGDIFTFDASESTDPDGEIIEFKWTIPETSTQKLGKTTTINFSTLSLPQQITLTIIDDSGGVSLLQKTIEKSSEPTLLASDNFNSYPHATDLSTTTNWAGLTGTLLCLSGDTLRGDLAYGLSSAYWKNNTFDSSQYAEATLGAAGGGVYYGGALVRGGLSDSSNPQFYAVVASGKHIKLYSYDGDNKGAELTEIATYAQALSAGGKVRVEVTGTGTTTRLSVYHDADGKSGWTPLVTNINPDDYFDTGSPGVAFWGHLSSTTVSAWAGGNL